MFIGIIILSAVGLLFTIIGCLLWKKEKKNTTISRISTKRNAFNCAPWYIPQGNETNIHTKPAHRCS